MSFAVVGYFAFLLIGLVVYYLIQIGRASCRERV